jgi:hypothetical protein
MSLNVGLVRTLTAVKPSSGRFWGSLRELSAPEDTLLPTAAGPIWALNWQPGRLEAATFRSS